jgi:hypothetical protein
VENGAAGGIGEGVKDGIEPGGVRLNHMVECSPNCAELSTDWLNVLGGWLGAVPAGLYARRG